MGNEDIKRIVELLSSIQFDQDLFKLYIDQDTVVFGAIVKDIPKVNRFFSYKTIYDSIIDTAKKAKRSIILGIQFAEKVDLDEWDPFTEPPEEEWMAMYYMENALFRVSVLWDLLAQMYNIKKNIGKPNDEIHCERFFHNAQQGKGAKPFAVKVYSYLAQEEDKKTIGFTGNHSFIKGYRDQMMHRNSPSVSTYSDFGMGIRLPALYYLTRLTEDFAQVSQFIKELVSEVLEKEL